MRELIELVYEYLFYAVDGIVLFLLLFGTYYFIYCKLLKGKKRIHKKQGIIIVLLIGYVSLVVGATITSRVRGGAYFDSRNLNLEIFSSYIEAWNLSSFRAWKLIVYNILMFVPIGFLLPLVHSKMKSAIRTISVSFLFTVFIECIQLALGLGIFEIDDIFNNTLGAIFGYCLIMILCTIFEKEDKGSTLQKKVYRTIKFAMPMVIACFISIGFYIADELQEFGNLRYLYGNVDMNQVEITSDIPLSDESKTAMVYETKIYSVKEAEVFAREFFKERKIDSSTMKTYPFEDDVLFEIDNNYRLYFTRQGGTYSFYNYSYENEMEEEEIETIENTNVIVEEEEARNALKTVGVSVPDGMVWEKNWDDPYHWEANIIQVGDNLINGTLSVTCNRDGKVTQVDNHVVTFMPYKEKEIISEKEAYEVIQKGNFAYYRELSAIKIKEVALKYEKDTKYYYQPVYTFLATIDGAEESIQIPALR